MPFLLLVSLLSIANTDYSVYLEVVSMRNLMSPTYLFCLLFASAPQLLLSQQVLGSDSIRGSQIEVDVHGNITLLETERNTIRRLTRELAPADQVGGSGWRNDQFDRPSGVWARNGIDVFVADYGNHRIQRFDRSLNFVSSLSTRESDNAAERFGYPTDVALSRLGDLYICDSENTRIVKVDRSNRVERSFGGFDAGKGRLRNPRTLEIGPRDRVYVLDGTRILVFDSFGNFMRQVAGGMFQGSPPVIFADEKGLVVLSSDVLYCFDEEDRLQASIALESLVAGRLENVRSLAFSAKKCYLLTDSGLLIVVDPRTQERLE